MKTIALIIIFILSLIFWIAIHIIKSRAYDKGYTHGCKDMADKIMDQSHWFSSYPMVYNVMYLFGAKMKKNPHFGTWTFRDDILKIGDRRCEKEDVSKIV